MFVCVCNCISETDIKNIIELGVTTFEEIQLHTNLGKSCGSCKIYAKDFIQKCLLAAST